MVVEIDMRTCPATSGRPSGRKSLRRRDIQRRDALLRVPNYCGVHHLSRSKGTSVVILPVDSAKRDVQV